MELKKSKTINSFEVINGTTDIFLGVTLTVNKRRVFSRTKGHSMEATVDSFMPPLDELINNKATKQRNMVTKVQTQWKQRTLSTG